MNVPWLGKTTVGPSGFRFVRLDNADPKIDLQLSQVRAILTIRDIPYVGSFKCADERLNQIWQTGPGRNSMGCVSSIGPPPIIKPPSTKDSKR